MAVRFISSKQNARLKELRRALSSPGRGGLAAIEGPHLLEEGLRAGLHIPCIFAAEEAAKFLEALHVPAEVETLLMPKALLDEALTTENPHPVAALVEPPDWTWAHFSPASGAVPLVVVAAGLQDPGNLGTIFRSSEAFGATGVVSLPGTVNAWNPKAVRASAGSVLRVPVIAADEETCIEELREAGMRILTTTVHRGEPDFEFDMTGPTALIVGNEGSGVPEALAARADARITIPCPGPVESLNAAVAASVLLYEAARQRAAVSAAQPAKRRAR